MGFFFYGTHALLSSLPGGWWPSDTHRIIWTMMIGLILHIVVWGALTDLYPASGVARILRHNCMYIVAADVAAVAVLFRQRWGHTLTSHYGDALLGPPASAHGPRFSPLYEELAKQQAAAVAPQEAKGDDVRVVPPPLPPQPVEREPEKTEEEILEDINVPAEVDVTSPTNTTSV